MRSFSSLLLCPMARHLGQLNRISRARWCQSHLNRFLFSNITTDHGKKFYIQCELLSRSFHAKAYISYNQHYAHFSTLRMSSAGISVANQSQIRDTIDPGTEIRNETNNQIPPEVEIISKELIKPATPTPKHSRTYEVSIFDQLIPNIYMSFVFFFPNYHQNADDLILERRQVLKKSLSDTLTRFYPLAGRIKDSRHIDCNDEGVYYVEAKVSDHMSDFLKHPDNKSIHRLLPIDPNSEELFSRRDLAMVQVTVFGCGGISVGLYTGHRIIDGFSFATFVKSWSATARATSEQIKPIFISSSVFPSNPALPHDATSVFFPIYSKSKNLTRRFFFPASSLAALKQKVDSTRVLAVAGLIWKCAIAASKARSAAINGTSQSSSTLALAVNLRDRISPPSPPHSIGNIFMITAPVHCSESDDLGLDSIVQHLKNVTKQLNSEFIEKWIREALLNVETVLNVLRSWYSDKDAKQMLVTSVCNSGIYETDFGWGKPLWICVGNGDSISQFTENFVVLMDTKCGNGIEAWVTLPEEDMKVFEQNPEILAYASLNVNPLELAE